MPRLVCIWCLTSNLARTSDTKPDLWLAGGHNVDPVLTFFSVVSRDSVGILFLVAAMNELDAKSALQYHNHNAYIAHVITGPELGTQNKGSIFIVQKALYGLKSAARRCILGTSPAAFRTRWYGLCTPQS